MGYLVRRTSRLAFEVLKKEIIFGLLVSTLLLGIGCWRYFIVIGANDDVARALAIAGAVGWLLTLLIPSLWKGPEQALGFVMRKAGSILFAILLSVIYAVLIVPVGILLRRFSGSGPIVAWDGPQPGGAIEGWRAKEVAVEARLGGRGKASLVRRFVNVLQFFARRGHYVFLPTLLILLALSVVLFFVKSSALAPFIYTLF
jgi:hypothetical protein